MMAESAYKGYARRSDKDAQVRAAKDGFDRDYEGMKTAYETYKRSGDPSAKEMSRRIGRGDENAIRKVERAGRESVQEKKRETRRGGRD